MARVVVKVPNTKIGSLMATLGINLRVLSVTLPAQRRWHRREKEEGGGGESNNIAMTNNDLLVLSFTPMT